MTRRLRFHKPWKWMLVFACAALAAATSAQAGPPQTSAGDLEVIEVRPNLYMIAGAGANIAVQVGPIGVILVNAGREDMADKVLAAVKKITDQPIRYILDTSGDADVVGGNGKLSKAGRTILAGAVGQSGVTEDVINNGGSASTLAQENVLLRMSAPTGKAAPFPEDEWPSKTYAFEKGYAMSINGEGIQMIPVPHAHTDGDSIVLFRHTDVIVAGDVYDTTRFPVIDIEKGGGIQGEIAALNKLLELTIPPVPFPWDEGRTLLIPGHGRIGDDSDLVEYRDMITIIRDNVQDYINSGMTLDQIKKADPAKAYRPRYGADTGPWTTDMFIEAIYKGLTERKGK